MMYIQRASEARRSYASIMHVATRFDGNREGDLLTMDTNNMVDFLEDFYRESPVKAEQIEFVEAYGCGLKVMRIKSFYFIPDTFLYDIHHDFHNILF